MTNLDIVENKISSVRKYLKILERRKIIFCFAILGFFCFVQISLAANNPVLFFSDLIDGPKTGWNGSLAKGAFGTLAECI